MTSILTGGFGVLNWIGGSVSLNELGRETILNSPVAKRHQTCRYTVICLFGVSTSFALASRDPIEMMLLRQATNPGLLYRTLFFFFCDQRSVKLSRLFSDPAEQD